LPFADDAFFGVGSGTSPEAAREKALIDIRMQLNSRIDAIVHSVERSDAQETRVSEQMERYIDDSPLSGAILEDRYFDGSRHWALLRFKEDCGQILMSSAIVRFQDELQIPDEEANEIIQNARLKEVLQISRRIDELDLEEYSSEDIEILVAGEDLVLRLINFLPDMASLSPKQTAALQALGDTLFKEILAYGFTSIDIVGHANPTGRGNEEAELEELSRQRAEILAAVLRDTGMTVTAVSWEGGRQTIGDPESETGKGRNRRVEIILRFE
jgi:outer membrane protein OmpA-like peptidoglycan-associated protein